MKVAGAVLRLGPNSIVGIHFTPKEAMVSRCREKLNM